MIERNLRNYLVSTAEDFLDAGTTDIDTIAWSVANTAARRGEDVLPAEVVAIIQDAIMNLKRGKRAKYNALTLPRIR